MRFEIATKPLGNSSNGGAGRKKAEEGTKGGRTERKKEKCVAGI